MAIFNSFKRICLFDSGQTGKRGHKYRWERSTASENGQKTRNMVSKVVSRMGQANINPHIAKGATICNIALAEGVYWSKEFSPYDHVYGNIDAASNCGPGIGKRSLISASKAIHLEMAQLCPFRLKRLCLMSFMVCSGRFHGSLSY